KLGLGEAVLVTARSADELTVVVAVLELLAGVGSVVADVAVAMFTIALPLAVLLGTATTIWKAAVLPAGKVGLLNTQVPVPPTGGAAPLQPVPVITAAETNVVPAGTLSDTWTALASLGPLLMKLIV